MEATHYVCERWDAGIASAASLSEPAGCGSAAEYIVVRDVVGGDGDLDAIVTTMSSHAI